MGDLKPANVSPLIKTSRWFMLGAGVVYGFLRRRELKVIEDKHRAEMAEKKRLRDEELARTATKRNEEQINDVMKQLGLLDGAVSAALPVAARKDESKKDAKKEEPKKAEEKKPSVVTGPKDDGYEDEMQKKGEQCAEVEQGKRRSF